LEIIPDQERGIIRVNNVPVSDLTSIELVDISGKTILKEKLFNTNNQVDLSGKKGMFLVKVSTGKTIVVRKIVF